MLTKRCIILSTAALVVVALAILASAAWLRHNHASQTAAHQAAGRAPQAGSGAPASPDAPAAATTAVPFRPGLGPTNQQATQPKRMTIAEFSAHVEQDMARVAVRQAQSKRAASQAGAGPSASGAAASTASAADQGGTPDGAVPVVRQPQVLDGNPFKVKPPPHRPRVQPGPNPTDNTPTTTSPG